MRTAWLLPLLLAACSGKPLPVADGARPAPPLATAPEANAIVNAPDRTPADRATDAARRPAELLTFLGVRPGMRVGELLAGAGYTAELLARAVAPSGVVYAQNPSSVLAGSGAAWLARLATPSAKTIVPVTRELDDPLPAEAKNLDLVVANLIYHDLDALGVDRQKMNRAIFNALRTGGRYAILDHAARPGRGFADGRTLHRVDEVAVRREVEGAGFRFEAESSFLRNSSDTRDWNASPQGLKGRLGASDRFALMFVK